MTLARALVVLARLTVADPIAQRLASVTVKPAGAPYPGAEVHRWSLVTKLQDPNGYEATEADAAVRKAMAPLVGRDDWEYSSGRAGERWSKRYDASAEAWRWYAEVRRV